MTLKWIKTMSQILDVKLRLDHTLSQSTDKLRSDNSYSNSFNRKRFCNTIKNLLYIKETDADQQMVQSSPA